MQVSVESVLGFLDKVFAHAPAVRACKAEDRGAAGEGQRAEGSAAKSSYVVLPSQQLAAELDAKPEVLETLLTYLEVGWSHLPKCTMCCSFLRLHACAPRPPWAALPTLLCAVHHASRCKQQSKTLQSTPVLRC